VNATTSATAAAGNGRVRARQTTAAAMSDAAAPSASPAPGGTPSQGAGGFQRPPSSDGMVQARRVEAHTPASMAKGGVRRAARWTARAAPRVPRPAADRVGGATRNAPSAQNGTVAAR